MGLSSVIVRQRCGMMAAGPARPPPGYKLCGIQRPSSLTMQPSFVVTYLINPAAPGLIFLFSEIEIPDWWKGYYITSVLAD